MKKMIKKLSEITINANSVGKYYLYSYSDNSNNNVARYIGQGSDGDAPGDARFKRARNIGAHNSTCRANYDVIDVKIIAHYESKQHVTAAEAAYIKMLDTVNTGWNRREELRDKKYFDLLNSLDMSDHTIESLIEIALQTVQGDGVIAPDGLVYRIYNKANLINNKSKDDVLFVGNTGFGGINLLHKYQEIVDVDKIDNKTIFTTKEGIYKMVRDNILDLTVRATTENFLETNFNEKYDLIIMNPPWADEKKITNKDSHQKTSKNHGGGSQFIDKAVSLLKKGGKLIAINSYSNFTSLKKTPGTFSDLLNRGYFERIEVQHGSSYKTPYNFFPNKGRNVWFIFVKDVEPKDHKTTIMNAADEVFQLKIKKDSKYVPQTVNHYDIFDDEGFKVVRIGNKTSRNYSSVIIKSVKSGISVSRLPAGEKTTQQVTAVKDVNNEIDIKKLENLLNKMNKKLYYLNILYSIGSTLRLPPIKKSLIIKDKNES